ncbi:MAG: Na+/H+ antiporter subunit E [Fimbriimonadaceae bacterium]|nr:Na+/H+ antiporter subunit E [Fimbriimonadaceae bacterium]
MIIWSLILGGLWVCLNGSFTLGSWLMGSLVGWAVLRMSFPKGMEPESRQLIYLSKLPAFILFFLRELVLANLVMAADLLSNSRRLRPGVIAIPLDVKTDAQIELLATLITLTPGTLSLDVASDRSKLYVHAMFLPEQDIDRMRQLIKEGFESRILALFR